MRRNRNIYLMTVLIIVFMMALGTAGMGCARKDENEVQSGLNGKAKSKSSQKGRPLRKVRRGLKE